MSSNAKRPFFRRPSQSIDHPWYLLVMFGLLLLFWLYAWYIERVNTSLITAWLESQNLSILSELPGLSFMLEFFHWKVLRHTIAVLVGWYFAYDAAVILVRVLYDLPDRANAKKFLSRLLGLLAPPGKAKEINPTTLAKERHESTLLRVGGPGKVAVPTGYVMVTEMNGRLHRIRAAGIHTLGRYEYIHALLNLQPQERSADQFAAYSRDGIELRVGVSLKYRIKKGQQAISKENPYPYDETAVRTAAYSQTVIDDKGSKGTWEDAPLIIAKATLGGILASFRLDEIIFPEQPGEEPYRTLRNELRRKLRAKLDGLGINLLEVAINRLDLPPGVNEQVIEYWKSNWESQMLLKLVDGEATAVEEVEIARAEAEMTMIQAILEGVQRARREGATAHMDEV
ncbi:MAG: hypothetical protein GY805_26770, partial [Chloroflexi bacterium]|nr:hypothetical protein [Chloroflexota bacterium]